MPTNNFIQTSPKVQNLRSRMQQVWQLAAERAAGHLHNPQAYPLPGDAKSLETALYHFFAALSNHRQKKVLDKILPRIQASAATRQQWYGSLATVSLTAAKSIAAQAAAVPTPQNLRFTQADAEIIIHAAKPAGYSTGKTKPTGYPTGKSTPVPAVAVNPTLIFVIDSLTCQKTSEVRKDEIKISGIGTNNLNQPQNLAPFAAGDFKKGDAVTLNRNLFSFELDNNSSVALSFTASLFLTDEDWISNTALAQKLTTVFVTAGLSLTIIAAGMGVASVAFPALLPATVVVLAAGIGLQLLGGVFGFAGDDISEPATEVIVLEPPFVVGTREDRVMNFELLNANSDLTTGKYTAAVHWEVIA
jgi:hypothetical protein